MRQNGQCRPQNACLSRQQISRTHCSATVLHQKPAESLQPSSCIVARYATRYQPPLTLSIQPGPTWTSSARASARARKTNSSNTTSPTLTVSRNVKIPQTCKQNTQKAQVPFLPQNPAKNATEDANMFGWCLLSGSYGCYPLDLLLPLLYPGRSKRGAKHRGSQRWPKLSIDHDLYC